jgi:hypothetical protein
MQRLKRIAMALVRASKAFVLAFWYLGVAIVRWCTMRDIRDQCEAQWERERQHGISKTEEEDDEPDREQRGFSAIDW